MTRDLMARMGHDSMQAALVYQHASAEAARPEAETSEARREKGRRDGDGGGAAGLLVPVA